MSGAISSGRLSTLQAAFVVARRDFGAILFSRTFFFFLLGPLFPVIVGIAAGSVKQETEQAAARPVLGVVMAPRDADAMIAAGAALRPELGDSVPDMAVVKKLRPGETIDAAQALKDSNGNLAAVVTGSLASPQLTGTEGLIRAWSGPVALIAGRAADGSPQALPKVALAATASSVASERNGQMRTAQGGQMLLFLLTMMLAGMVLSNLVEEKANKIIEVLAAAIPMEAVFYGKLFAMLGVSLVGIAVWGAGFGGLILLGSDALSGLAAPAVGWPAFVAFGIGYFAMAYLLLGSVFLTIGSMASTVREVQTISMPVSMSQLMIFFFATYAAAQPGTGVSLAAELIPFSSPFAMLARAAQDGAVLPHVLAVAWQVMWVAIFVHFGSRLFRRRVMKSGPQQARTKKGKGQPVTA
ncbi:ABC transporter permease [Novosphingobium sp.]|uniref:ABC transporter permease n=1 Tax=Novosphingobium sp. TaxID=1874826 RepID=UPI00286E43E1|nr:ABC transporter permease [Novosphingobium sp.]